MKKAAKWIGIAVLTPILLFLTLTALLYLPPVQNWLADKVASIASEKTGMEISVGTIRLEWPLDIGIDDFRMLHQNDSLPQVRDTIADVAHLTVDVRLLPLFNSRVVIDELSLRKAKINTNGFISDLRIKGEMGELWLSSKGIDLDKETAEINGARLSDANIDLALGDTAAVDTAKSEIRWFVKADSLTLSRTDLTLHMPGDTLCIRTHLGNAVARDTDIDIGKGVYQVACLDWREGAFRYDDRRAPEAKGFDSSHIALTDLTMHVDSFSYSPSGTSLFIKEGMAKERSGIELTHVGGGVRLDSLYNNIQLSKFSVRTTDSDILTDTDMDFNAFDDSDKAGRMMMRLNAQLGKQDLIRFMGELPQEFIRNYPNQPISIKGSLNGNIQNMELTGLNISQPTAFNINLNGTAGLSQEKPSPTLDLKVNAKLQDVNFLLALSDPSLLKSYRIPNGIYLDGKIGSDGNNRYSADLTAREDNGTVKLKGSTIIPKNARGDMAIENITYDADLSISNLNLHHFMPKDSLYTLSADITAKGHGTDFFSTRSHLTADATITQLHYGSWNLTGLTASALLRDGRAHASITGRNRLFDGTIGIDALLNKTLDGKISADIANADLYRMRLVGDTLAVGFKGDIDIKSDLNKTHYLSGLIGDITIKDEKKTYKPDRIGLLVRTNADTTYVRAQSGDLIVKLDGSGYYERLLSQITTLTDTMKAQFENKVIDQEALKRLLPIMKLHVESKHDNPIANLLHTSDISFKELLVDMNTSPETGVNGKSHIYSLNYDSIRIDTVRIDLTQKGNKLTYQGQIRNNKKNPQFVFNALIDGHFHEHGALAGLRYYDDKNRLGVRIGATAEMETGGIRMRLMPDRPTVGYKEFNLNKDNFIFLAQGGKIQAKVDLIADDKTGLKLYTENQDSTMLQDLTVSVNSLDLGELSAVIPYLPRITGKLNGDFHILQDHDEHISVASDMAVQTMTYEGSPIGNISTELVYLMKEDDTHAIEARLMLDDEEFGLLSGTYQNEGEGLIDATMTMTRFPLSLANGFVPDQIVGLEGFAEGTLSVKGSTHHSDVDGELYVEDAYLVSEPYGVRMRMDDDPIRIKDSKLLIENYGLYAYNNEPLNMMGEVDFTDFSHITMDLRMRAQNLQLINARQEAKSIAFGKAFVNLFARMQGPLEQLNIRGRLDVLGSTDMTYMLLDSPLSTDNRLDELVKFTDFSDTTEVIVTRPMPTGLTADLTISMSDGAHIICGLNPDQTNYVDLTGGGNLRMKYNAEGIDLTGRYTINSGVMKYSLPVIPLKTFTIQNGSYVEFTGDPMNPRLSITATERTKATVKEESGATRSVAFECGVEITKTLADMGLQFVIEAPEDNLINGELSTMSLEERGKIAVAMITTGMYLDSSSAGNFSMNSALSAFLQNEINNIAGSALKTVDISVGVENSVNSAGEEKTDYSFQFSKRLLDNRLKIQIGGLLSGGANTAMGQKQSFFDNVSMEYRLNQESTQNLKLFYKQNVYDWLDGYTSEYGGGFIWRRKLDSFWDIFRLHPAQQQSMPPMRQDTIKVKR